MLHWIGDSSDQSTSSVLTDPLTLAGVVVLLGAVAFAASYLPARSAAQIDPQVALRRE
jgi:ABC-type lipoprotein release transport system permease subunit